MLRNPGGATHVAKQCGSGSRGFLQTGSARKGHLGVEHVKPKYIFSCRLNALATYHPRVPKRTEVGRQRHQWEVVTRVGGVPWSKGKHGVHLFAKR